MGVAVLTALGAPLRSYQSAPVEVVHAGVSTSASSLLKEPWRCPPRTLAVDVAFGETSCLPLPPLDAHAESRTRRLAEVPPTPAYLKMTAPSESIPRLPERSAHFGDYQLPVSVVISVGSDVDSIEDESGQRRPKLGVNIVTEPGAPVTLVDLEGETGRPEVVLVGQLYGITVVVRHRVSSDEADGAREYLVFYGNLSRPGPSVTSGAILSPMSVIGFVTDEEGEEPAVYFEVRQQEEALAGPAQHLTELVSKSIAVDARNVLPLLANRP